MKTTRSILAVLLWPVLAAGAGTSTVLVSAEKGLLSFDPPPDYELTLPAACGPSPEGDCSVYYWLAFSRADFEGGVAEFAQEYPHRRVCCGGQWCTTTYPGTSGLPVILPEAELVTECQAVGEIPP